MQKILLIATVQSHIAQFHKPLINVLNENGYIVDIAARNNLKEKNGLKIENINNVYDIPFSRNPINKNNINAYKQLKEIVLKNDYDILHCNTPMGGIITRLIKKKNKNLKSKIIYTAHGFHFYKGAPIINWLVYYPIEKYFSKYTDVLITINDEDYNTAKNKFKNVNVQKINSTGIDLTKFQNIITEQEKEFLRKDLRIQKEDFSIINIGELNKNKNQIMQLKAIKLMIEKGYKNVKLFICGNGPLENEYRQYIKESNLENNVILLGYRTDVNKILQIADCAISTSIREGLGINILEAMASGVPVIATENRGHKELIKNNINGYLARIGDIDELIKDIEKIIENKNEDIIKNEKEEVKKYSENIVKSKLLEIYKSLE